MSSSRKLSRKFTKIFSKEFSENIKGFPSCARDYLISWYKNLNTSLEDSVGVRIDTVYYGQYLAQNSIINFYRTSGTFDYINPQTGASVLGVTIPLDGLYTVPVSGICEVTTSDGSYYPVCERAGNVLHDVKNGVHLSITTPTWTESLNGSDYLNQNGYINKTTNDSYAYTWTTVVNGSSIVLDNSCLIPLKPATQYSPDSLDSTLNFILS